MRLPIDLVESLLRDVIMVELSAGLLMGVEEATLRVTTWPLLDATVGLPTELGSLMSPFIAH